MNLFQVPPKGRVAHESHFTLFALERSLRGVPTSLVPLQVAQLLERTIALVTLVRLLPGVDVDVMLELHCSPTHVGADVARKTLGSFLVDFAEVCL